MKLEYNKDSNVGIAPFGYDPRAKLIITKYIMTPKEKAIELFDNISNTTNIWDINGNADYNKWYEESRKNTLKIVNTIILVKNNIFDSNTNLKLKSDDYWDKVKQEIEKL